MAPKIFYRVESKYSCARYAVGEGVSAKDSESLLTFESPDYYLRKALSNHLEWNCKTPSMFISVYSEESVAMKEAKRRINERNPDVRVLKIDMRKHWRASSEQVEYRDLRFLAQELGVWIEKKAWNNSKYEYIFLKHIPEDVIVEIADEDYVKDYVYDLER
jgi:hypothetical protein